MVEEGREVRCGGLPGTPALCGRRMGHPSKRQSATHAPMQSPKNVTGVQTSAHQLRSF
jgi:hypothetical protein